MALKKLIAERGLTLMRAGQQVACITYTEVARNEIAREIEARGATPFLDEAQVDAGADFEEDILEFL